MDRQRVSAIAHAHHPIAAPVAGVNVNKLLRRAARGPAARILDLGCGQAVWARQAPAHSPDGQAAIARTHSTLWLSGYRNVLGFATLVLRPDAA